MGEARSGRGRAWRCCARKPLPAERQLPRPAPAPHRQPPTLTSACRQQVARYTQEEAETRDLKGPARGHTANT